MTRPLLLMLFICLAACDNQSRFLGHDYEAENVAQNATIDVEVYDGFSGELIQGEILLDVNGQQYTILDGDLEVSYVIGADESLDRPVPVTISSEIFFGWDSSMVVYPGPNYLSTRLTWAAPIIESSVAVRVIDSPVTATIFDYQGEADIDSVFFVGIYFFDYGNEVSSGRHAIPMDRLETLDGNRAVYRAVIPQPPNAVALDDDVYEIRVVDRSGFVEAEIFWWVPGDTLQ